MGQLRCQAGARREMSSAVLSSLLLWMNSSNKKLNNNGISCAGAHLSPHLALLYRRNLDWGHVLCCDPIKSRIIVNDKPGFKCKQPTVSSKALSWNWLWELRKSEKKQASGRRWYTWLQTTPILRNQDLRHRCSEPSTAQSIELNSLQANYLTF
jgi:hypothetical protein